MTSPCKDCTRRKVGCHNVETCPDWAVHVERTKARYAARKEKMETMDSIEDSVRRRGGKLSQR